MTALSETTSIKLLPWQQHVHDVGLEVGRDGNWLHNTVATVVARQNGKTSAILARRILAGLYLFGDYNILHAAQNRNFVLQTFHAIVAAINSSPWLKREVKDIKYAIGSEHITLKDGSTYRIMAPTQQSFRGQDKVGLIVFDEILEQKNDALWSAAKYTQRVHANPQIWVASNAGNADSVVLNTIRDRGRASVEEPGSDPSIAYFEWSAPEGAAIDDPESWAYANPSLGHLIDSARIVEELRSDTEDRFRTESLCQWVDTSSMSAVPRAAWMAAGADIPTLSPDPERPVWMSIEIDPEHERASLVAATWIDERLVVAQVAQWDDENEPVTEARVAADVLKWVEMWKPRTVGYDPFTSQGIADVISSRVDVDGIRSNRWSTACAQLWDVVVSGVLVHSLNDQVLTDDVLAAGRRSIGDGVWMMSRRNSLKSIPAATALGRAVHLAVSPQIVPAIYR